MLLLTIIIISVYTLIAFAFNLNRFEETNIMKLKLTAAAILSTLMITGCGSDNDAETPFPHDLSKLQKLVNTNAELAYAKYYDSVATAIKLQTALATFEGSQTQENLDAAKKAWLVAREPYGQSEVFRFRSSPIDDDPATTEGEDGPEGAVNAWPLGEALIDYVQSTTDDFNTDQIGVTAFTVPGVTGVAIESGPPDNRVTRMGINRNHAVTSPADNIIGANMPINDALISATATADDEHDVIAGYHAIEFLLWGQDLNNDALETTSADRSGAVKNYNAPIDIIAHGGKRPLSDFNTTGGCTTNGALAGSNSPCERRHTYLKVATQKLINDLTGVRDHWAPNVAGNYRASFTNVPDINTGKQRFLEILTGMGTMSEGELAGERMQIALAANSQEDEHSCFSDNTHRDIWTNAVGVSNSFTGSYAGYDSDLDGTVDMTGKAVSGYGIDEYLTDTGEIALAAAVLAALSVTETGYKAIDAKARAGFPVDVVIVNPTGTDAKPMRDTVVALNAQSVLIAKIAVDLGLGTADQVVDPDASECDTTDPTQEC